MVAAGSEERAPHPRARATRPHHEAVHTKLASLPAVGGDWTAANSIGGGGIPSGDVQRRRGCCGLVPGRARTGTVLLLLKVAAAHSQANVHQNGVDRYCHVVCADRRRYSDGWHRNVDADGPALDCHHHHHTVCRRHDLDGQCRPGSNRLVDQHGLN